MKVFYRMLMYSNIDKKKTFKNVILFTYKLHQVIDFRCHFNFTHYRPY